jgi:formamidopyrimidine-DNA glycosylase
MPELPEVETVCRGLAPVLEGHRLVQVVQRRPDLRFPLPERFAERLTGRRIKRVRRRGKYILITLDRDEVLLCHLGMSGRMLLSEQTAPPPSPHDHILFTTDEGRQVRFNDVRRFGIMDLVPETELSNHWLLRDLGPEPLGNAFSGPVLAAALRGKRTSIKAALLDQRVVAGIGNIYACEGLYAARLSPRRLAYTVQGRRAERLARALRDVLTRAVAAGGSSLRDYVQTSGELGYFQHAWAVYDREGLACPDCCCVPAETGGIRRVVQSNRSTFYCPRLQR